MANQFTKVQTVAAQNGASPIGTLNVTFIATGLNNLLVAIVGANNNATITPPAGWRQVGNNIPITSGGNAAMFVYPNCAPGLTSQIFTISPNALAIVLGGEWSGGDLSQGIDDFSFVNFSPGTGFTTNNFNCSSYTDLLIGGVIYINNTAVTPSNTANYINHSNVITTAASGNVGGILFSDEYAQSSTSIFSGNISVAPTAGPTALAASFKLSVVEPSGYVGPTNHLG